MSDLPPTIFVLYGATGDLAKKMVLPAFYALSDQGLMPEQWLLIGNGRKDQDDAWFVDHVRETLGDQDLSAYDDFARHLRFAGEGFTKDDPGQLLDGLGKAREELGDDTSLVHYIATPPVSFRPFTEAIEAHDVAKGARVVYEKPYGQSPSDFADLEELVHRVFDEEQVYRLDHFLGKEATQDLHVLRFGNAMLHDVWDREHIAQVQIDLPETLDVGDRAEFYDANGATKDMLVTHMFQVAAEIAMEPPVSMRAEDLAAAREGVLAAFRPLDPAECVRGQFDGYLEVEGVDEASTTDTFVAATLWVDTDRWQGVPFVLRTGKMLAVSEQRVSIVFRQPDSPLTHVPPQGNVLTLVLSGNGGLQVQLVTKLPGPDLELTTGTLGLELETEMGARSLPAYSSLLHDVITGDRSLFTSSAGLEAAWRAVAPLLDAPPEVVVYKPGSWGPDEASALADPVGWLLHA